jgi:hypothetical protein
MSRNSIKYTEITGEKLIFQTLQYVTVVAEFDNLKDTFY